MKSLLLVCTLLSISIAYVSSGKTTLVIRYRFFSSKANYLKNKIACDCSWASRPGACGNNDGSVCWKACCGSGTGSNTVTGTRSGSYK